MCAVALGNKVVHGHGRGAAERGAHSEGTDGQRGGHKVRGDKRVLEDGVEGGALARVRVQQVADQVLCISRDLDGGGDGVVVVADLAVRCLDVACLKRRLAKQQRVKNAPNRPHVNLKAVTLAALENLGGNVVWGSTQRPGGENREGEVVRRRWGERERVCVCVCMCVCVYVCVCRCGYPRYERTMNLSLSLSHTHTHTHTHTQLSHTPKCCIVRNSLLALAVKCDGGGETKVANLHVHAWSEKQVAELEVAVDDFSAMHVLCSKHNLHEVIARLCLCEGAPALMQLHHRLQARRKEVRRGGVAGEEFGYMMQFKRTRAVTQQPTAKCQRIKERGLVERKHTATGTHTHTHAHAPTDVHTHTHSTHLIGAELKEDVDVVLILKKTVKPNNVLLLEAAVDLNLGAKLKTTNSKE